MGIQDMIQSVDLGITEEELRAAANWKMTPEQRREQMISFILGMRSSKSKLTREDVVKFLDDGLW